MSEINKEGFFNGKLETVQRSNIYWAYTNKIKAVMYANNFTHFFIDRAKELQNIMRTKAPDVVGDWYDLMTGKITANNSKCWNQEKYFKEGISWNLVASGRPSARLYRQGTIFDISGPTYFSDYDTHLKVMAFFNTKICNYLAEVLSPTLNFSPGLFEELPIIDEPNILNEAKSICKRCIEISKRDWDSFETSWDFKEFFLLKPEIKSSSLELSFINWSSHCTSQIEKMTKLESDNNRIFLKSYRLQNNIDPEVPKEQITLYRSNRETDKKHLISYAIGCMMGRYSLDHQGLTYAHSGNIAFTPSKYLTFPPDDDGIIPIMDQDWFTDDAAKRFAEFLKAAWPPETLDENLKFVADCLKSN